MPRLPSHFSAYRRAPFTPGTYRARGHLSKSEYPTREIHNTDSSSFFVELQFADDASFALCVSAHRRRTHSTSEYTRMGESRSEDESDFVKGFAGTWRRDGDLAIAEVTAVRDDCDAKARATQGRLDLRCTGMVAADGAASDDGGTDKHRLVGCTLAGGWARSIQPLIAGPIGPGKAPWIIAGAPHGVDLHVSYRIGRPDIDVTITPAKRPLTRPTRP